jgi:hypothetical protein
MEISVHDNHLLSYTVFSETREIRLQTFFPAYDEVEAKYTDIIFTGVMAYRFINDSFGTIITDVSETSVESIYEEYEDLLEAGRPYGWPGIWNDSENREADPAYLSAQGIKGFYLSAAIGMTGWVLAKEMRFERRQPER